MRALILAVFLAAGCASAEPEPQQQSSASTPVYDDARSTATDAEVRDARRAYRSACQQGQSTDYCECMTGGMAQALSPADLNVATAALTGARSDASAETRARVERVRSEVDSGCAQYRRN